jgi:hypothetical protein
MPKEELFFTFQRYLPDTVINFDSIKQTPVSLSLNNSEIYYNGMDIASVKEIKILPLVFYNKVGLKNLDLGINNLKINTLNLVYTALFPLSVDVSGKASFGNIKGSIDLKKRRLKVYITDIKGNFIRQFLRKDKKGYFYETAF